MKGKTTRQGYQEIELLGARAAEGCPICHNLRQCNDHYFFWFFNENYYEAFTLDNLTRSLGFCLAHGASLARSTAGSHQLAAVHEVLVRRIRVKLSGGRAGNGDDEALTLARYDRCPPCRNREELAENAAFWLASVVENPAYADRYGQPGVLCYPHLQILAARVSVQTLNRVLTLHEAAMAAAMESLRELRVELMLSPSDGRQDLVKALLPSLRLAVGHDPGNAPYPRLAESRAAARKRNAVADLLEGLGRGDACPVCLEVRRAWLDWIGWLDEAASKPSPIDDLLPTCPEHVWPTVHAGSAFLAVATAERALGTVLEEVRMAIKVLKPPPAKNPRRPLERLKDAIVGPRRRFQAARAAIGRPVRCPVCARLALARDQALALLFALLEDPQHLARVEASYGLCLKHFSRAIMLDPTPEARAGLIAVENGKLAPLGWELDEALRKSAWNYRPEAKGAEQTTWRRAILRFSGSLGESAG